MTLRSRRNLHSVHSIVIVACTIGGLLWDGFQGSDVFFTVATVMWLWQPVLERKEQQLIDTICIKCGIK